MVGLTWKSRNVSHPLVVGEVALALAAHAGMMRGIADSGTPTPSDEPNFAPPDESMAIKVALISAMSDLIGASALVMAALIVCVLPFSTNVLSAPSLFPKSTACVAPNTRHNVSSGITLTICYCEPGRRAHESLKTRGSGNKPDGNRHPPDCRLARD
jgi:hypothetical protein